MKPTSPRLRVIVLAVSAAFADCALGQATPSYNSTQAGNATVNQTGSATTVTQTSQRAVLLWNSFNIGNGASVAFTQPNSSAIAVNRVPSAGGLSTIDGSLTANGNVMILNPNGVLFGAHASVNVAGLVASTGDINPVSNFAEFMAGGAFGITGATGGSVSTLAGASITVTGAGLAAFVAPSVSNAGVITATSGRITLASAQATTISLNGGLYEIAVNQGVSAGSVTNTGTLSVGTGKIALIATDAADTDTDHRGSVSNTGTLSAVGGTIVLSALDAANLVSGAINLEGIQQASRIEVNGGRVTLKSDLNATTVAGASAIVDVCHCGQIQDGIDIAASGGTVNIAAGTHTQTKTLYVNKSITLAGAGQDTTTGTVIDSHSVTSGPGSDGYGILVNADNVTLRDFTLYGPAVDAAASYGIKVQPASPSTMTSRLNNFTIARVTSRGAGRAELDLNGVNRARIDQFTANGAPVGNDAGTTKGAGIQVTDSNDVIITNSKTQNNEWGGIALFQTNKFFDQQTGNITIDATSNDLRESNPLYLQDESTSKDFIFSTLHLTGFPYAVRNTATIGSGSSATVYSQYTFMQKTAQDAFNLAVNLLAPDASYIQGWTGSALTQTFHVGLGNTTGGLRAMRVQTAVDRADLGATINVYPGSYLESASNRTIPGVPGTYTLGLLLDKSLTLRGVDASGAPIASADNVQAWIRSGAITDFGMAHAVTANDVTVEGLGFKPYSGSAPNKTIEIQADNFVFRNNVVDNRYEAGPGGTRAGGNGALYFGENDPTGHPINRLTVTGNKFYDGSVTLTNGVGANGTSYSPASDRVISNNNFIGSSNYRFGGLLLTGQMTPEIPWRTMPIGGATITGNSFSGFDDSVMMRGDQQGVDLRQVMAANSFDRSVLVTDSSGNARGEAYQSTNDGVVVRTRFKYSIQSSLQAGVNRAVSGDTVAVGAGTYAENVTVNAPLNFVFSGPTVQSMVFNANTGIAGSATADGAGFMFNAPVVLRGDTSLSTMGGNIAFNGDIQNVGTTPYALSLSSGSGDITMLSGGSQANPIGFFSVGANDFTLNSTLWVTGFNVGASGNIALSDHSLHATSLGSLNIISASGGVTGAVFSESIIVVNAGGDVQIIIDAPTGSSIKAGGTATVQNVGTGVVEVNGESRPNTQFASVSNNRIVPPDNALPSTSVVVTAPVSAGGGTEIQLPAEAAGDALDHGFPVEVDLTPGPKLRRR